MSPLGLTLELDILCPSGILRAFTMPSPSNAELKTLQTERLVQHARRLLPYGSDHTFDWPQRSIARHVPRCHALPCTAVGTCSPEG